VDRRPVLDRVPRCTSVRGLLAADQCREGEAVIAANDTNNVILPMPARIKPAGFGVFATALMTTSPN
jgi:hypothetical protein